MSRQDIGPGAQAALGELANARKESLEALMRVRAEQIPTNIITLGDSPVAYAHSTVFMYYDAVRPYRHGAQDLWQGRGLGSFMLAPPDAVDQGERVTINNLIDLDNWRNKEITYTAEHPSPGNTKATVPTTKTRRVWLPINVLQAVHDALSDVLVKSKLAAELPERGVGGEPA